MAKNIDFAEFAPDTTNLGIDVSPLINGALPLGIGFGPFKSFEDLTDTLPAPCRGAFWARRDDGRVTIFAATATRLYRLNGAFPWVDVSKGGLAYTSVTGDANWQFAKFNDIVIAVQPNTVPQKFLMSSSTEFADLGGSPPAAKFVAIIGLFVLLSGLTANPSRAQWSDLSAPESWTAGVGLSDFQDMADGGPTLGLAGGDAYGILFQESSIRSMIYAPGSPTVFQIVRISTQDTIYAPYGIINVGTRTFFLAATGFKVIENGGEPRPIGKDRVDRTFFAAVDKAAVQLIIGANDPTGTRVMWTFKSAVGGTSGLFDTVFCYDWSIGQNGRWSKAPLIGEWLLSLVKPTNVINDFTTYLGLFTSAHKLAVQTGANIEAIIETGEQDLQGTLVFVQAARPLTDCATAAVSVGCRIGPADTVSYTAESTVDNQGYAGILVETRYARGRLRLPAASIWSYARSLQVEAVPAGDT